MTTQKTRTKRTERTPEQKERDDQEKKTVRAIQLYANKIKRYIGTAGLHKIELEVEYIEKNPGVKLASNGLTREQTITAFRMGIGEYKFGLELRKSKR